LEAREWRFCFYEGEFQSFETVPAQICFGNIMLCIMIPLSDGPSNLSLKAALQLFHIKQLIFNINTRCTKWQTVTRLSTITFQDLLPDLPSHKKVAGFHMTSHSSIIVVVDDTEKKIQKYTLCSTDSKDKEVLPVIGQIGKTSSSLGGSDDDEFLATIHAYNLRIINVKTQERYK
jgi:hypothetical protein